MRIAVCDDCREDAYELKSYLSGQDVALYDGASSLLLELEEHGRQYDLYLLDIFMEDSINGIELAKRLRARDKDAYICFISSSDAFYREAYDLYAIQYLIKPVCEHDLKQLLERITLESEREQGVPYKWFGQAGTIPQGRVLFISSREHTILIQCKDGTVQKCKGKLSEMEVQVCGDKFMRCHQSFLVNMYQVDSLRGNELMISGHRIPVSRRYYAEVKRRYQEILFEEVN